MMQYGFNTFCTASHLPLVQVLVDSISSFSSYPIVVNCINFKHNFNNSNVISKSISTNTVYNLNCIYKYKWSTLLESEFDITAMLDADMIALPNIDNIFDENLSRLTNSPAPLFAKHPHNPFNNPQHTSQLFNMMSMITNHRPQMNYVYASGIVHRSHHEFIKNLVDIIDWFILNKISPYIEDEGLLNCLLAKYLVSESLDYNYFPNFTLYLDYINKTLDNSKELAETYTSNDCFVKFYAFHGCKDENKARLILNNILSMVV